MNVLFLIAHFSLVIFFLLLNCRCVVLAGVYTTSNNGKIVKRTYYTHIIRFYTEVKMTNDLLLTVTIFRRTLLRRVFPAQQQRN